MALYHARYKQLIRLVGPGVLRRSFHASQFRLAQNPRTSGTLPEPPQVSSSLDSPSDTERARAWVSQFKQHKIPRNLVQLTFSRSSGPGGQNVNKLNTKATLRCALDSPWIPAWARPDIRKSPYYTSSSQSILITSTTFRSQAQNIEDCLSKLHTLILSAASASIKNEPSEEQQKRVADLKRTEKASRLREKSFRSDIKKSRASSRRVDWD